MLGLKRRSLFCGIFFIALIFTTQSANAQGVEITSPRHAAYLEVGGSTSVYSLNYEFQPSRDFAFRVGAFSTPFGYRDATMHGGLLGGSYLIGGGRHKIELGGVLTGAFVSDNTNGGLWQTAPTEKGFGLGISPSIGYRFQPNDSGLLLRLAFTPLFSVSGPKFSQSPLKGGLSIGWKF